MTAPNDFEARLKGLKLTGDGEEFTDKDVAAFEEFFLLMFHCESRGFSLKRAKQPNGIFGKLLFDGKPVEVSIFLDPEVEASVFSIGYGSLGFPKNEIAFLSKSADGLDLAEVFLRDFLEKYAERELFSYRISTYWFGGFSGGRTTAENISGAAPFDLEPSRYMPLEVQLANHDECAHARTYAMTEAILLKHQLLPFVELIKYVRAPISDSWPQPPSC